MFLVSSDNIILRLIRYGLSIAMIILLMASASSGGDAPVRDNADGQCLSVARTGTQIRFDVNVTVDHFEICCFDSLDIEKAVCSIVEPGGLIDIKSVFANLVDGRTCGYFSRGLDVESGEKVSSDTIYVKNSEALAEIVVGEPMAKPLATAGVVEGAASAGYAHSYPNPFNPDKGEEAKIVFNPTTSGEITLLIYDLFGHLVYEETVSNASDLRWEGRNGRGELVASGGYICVLKTGDEVVSRHKIAVVK